MIKLDHPNIIKHHHWFKEEYFETQKNINVVRYCISMEYADDGDLCQKISTEQFTKLVTKKFSFIKLLKRNYSLSYKKL